MINIKEKTMQFVDEEKNVEEVEEEEEEEEDDEEGNKGESSDDGDENEDEEEGDEGETSSDDGDDEDESSSHTAGEKLVVPTQVKEKKNVLNVNNEVVKMRKEVKRIRSLLIRKLTRQIGALKKKTGTEDEVERNQKRATRLLEEVHCMKKLLPDRVTRTALRKNLNFEQVCKNPKSTISERAVARIGTHPQFSKKIESIKTAVKAFKEEHSKAGKQRGDTKVQRLPKKATLPPPDAEVVKQVANIQGGDAVEPREGTDGEKGVGVLKMTKDGAAAKAEKEIKKPVQNFHRKETTASTHVRSTPEKNTLEKDPETLNPPSKSDEDMPELQCVPTVLHVQAEEEEESDVASSDNEVKEYFDDSTEERFRKQSSQSEESDDDFFVGKVSKFKKKKKKEMGEEKMVNKGQDTTGSADNLGPREKLESQLLELESRLKSKALQSVFCSSLSRTKAVPGSDRRKGGGHIEHQGKLSAASRARGDYSDKQPVKGQEMSTSYSRSKFSKPYPDSRHPESYKKEATGHGRGRGGAQSGKDRRGGDVFSHEPPLHPSWEASKKRKEQQGQILAFQGKKIKFDDDD
ncbi:serum response factor-binding protein 1 [Nematolebias whitei]|uniref:serum response factor-binding protein 1 n=1 Tax=Nematolebias whitei TaxID=451745 RepID=UPI00189A3AC1|nr:serum response factor-binding protein 1 [Nematolebias whitei]